MHGMILVQFKVYLNQKYRSNTWLSVTSQMSLTKPLRPSTLRTYDDALFSDLLATACAVLKVAPAPLLEAFGVHLAGFFYESYKHMMDATWTFEQMLMRTENIMHRQVRFADVGALPPEIVVSRERPNRLLVVYQSERKLCALAKGLIRGFATLFDKGVLLDEPCCQLRGDAECRIQVSVVSEQWPPA